MKEYTYPALLEKKKQGRKSFALLIDPDNTSVQDAGRLIAAAVASHVDYIFVGGSLVITENLETLVRTIRQDCDIPVLLFPGTPSQITPFADALLYLSLISGRNPDLLIGQHVISAPYVKQSGLEIIPTGYMLIDGGAPTTASYISNAWPIPADKTDIAMCTAMAGEMLGLKLIFMDAGSGAKRPVSEEMIHRVTASIEVPLVVGGGIRAPEKAYLDCRAGADLIVVGHAIEKDPSRLSEMVAAVHSADAPGRAGEPVRPGTLDELSENP